MDVVRGELELNYIKNHPNLIGVDEVGRGCIAGPVFAACVSLDYEKLRQLPQKELSLIRDSKTLSQKQRASIIPAIKTVAREFAIASSSVAEIEGLGIVGATFAAMMKALSQCTQNYDLLLIDGNTKIPQYTKPQANIIGGDNSCYAIAAASIFAKEARDDFMREQAKEYPQYGFEDHVGYGTKQHIAAMRKHGLSSLHRRNFAPVGLIALKKKPTPHSGEVNWAEELVANLMMRQGWDIVARNFRSVGCEIDIIARKQETVVVVEVKQRAKPLADLQAAAELLPNRKQLALKRGADRFLSTMEPSPQTVRFDLAFVTTDKGKPSVQYYPNAFTV
jgi:ribonuclease HII